MFNKFAKLVIIIIIAAFSLGLRAAEDPLEFPAPQYMLPIYDHYTINYLNVEALGRGFTTNATLGGVENAVNNPATLAGEKSALYMELAIKPPISEINPDNDQMYASPIPFGMFGFSGKLGKGLLGAISYNVPKSIVYDAFSVEIGAGLGAVTRNPTYYLHQFTTTLAGKTGNLRYGINLHQQLHQFKDITVIYSFARLDETYYILRIQPGIVYKWNNINLGASFMPQTARKMDIGFLYYKTMLPWKVNTGLSAEFNNNRISIDAEWEEFSRMDAKFKDRFTVKGGVEKRIRNVTYRIGLASLLGVYEGEYILPQRNVVTPADTMWWGVVPKGGTIEKTDQINATIGFSYHFKGGKISMGLMRDLLGNVPSTQFAMALGFNLETLKGKKFLIFDK